MSKELENNVTIEAFDGEKFKLASYPEVTVDKVSEINQNASYDGLLWIMYDAGRMFFVHSSAESVHNQLGAASVHNQLGARSYLHLRAPIKGKEEVTVLLNPSAVRSVSFGVR